MSRKNHNNKTAVERDRQARELPNPHEVMGCCCGCQRDVTRKMVKNAGAIHLDVDTWLCNICEGGG